MWYFDQTQLEQAANSFLNNEGYAKVLDIHILDSAGKTLFKINGDKNFFDEKTPYIRRFNGFIKKDSQVLGTVFVTFSIEKIMENYKNVLSIIFIISILISGITGIGIYWFFNKILTRPLEKLLLHIRYLENEKYETIYYNNLSPELLSIGDTLNKASSLIKRRNDDLKDHNENLEKKIKERTQELENQIVQNIKTSRLASVGQVASGIAHEINNPLTVILGQVKKIKRTNNEQTPDDSKKSLEKISEMCERIVKIINGLKFISRDGDIDSSTEFSVLDVLDTVKTLTEMKINSQNIDFTIEIDEGVDKAWGKEVQISQVIVNLLNNSADAIIDQDNKWIKIKVINGEEKLTFEVTDSGASIPDQIVDKMMDPFFTTKEIGKGTGLGLSISKGIVENHGGELFYNSKSIHTQFIFTIRKHKEGRHVA